MPYAAPSLFQPTFETTSPIASALKVAQGVPRAMMEGTEAQFMPQLLQQQLAQQRLKAQQMGIETGYLSPSLQALLRQEQEKAKQAAITTQMKPAVTKSEIESRLLPLFIAEMIHPFKRQAPGFPLTQIQQEFSKAIGLTPSIPTFDASRGHPGDVTSPAQVTDIAQPAKPLTEERAPEVSARSKSVFNELGPTMQQKLLRGETITLPNGIKAKLKNGDLVKI